VNEDNIMKFERALANPPTLTPEQRARLDAMTDADVKQPLALIRMPNR